MQYWLVSKAHTMPLAVPFEEREGVAPGNGYVVDDCVDCAPPNLPVVGLNTNCVRAPFEPAK